MTNSHKWNIISSDEDLQKAVQESYIRKVILFKHSTRCSISKGVLSKFEKQMDESDYNIGYYFLSLLAHRDISNQIAIDFGIEHESPQIIVLEDGKAVLSASHRSIDLSKIL